MRNEIVMDHENCCIGLFKDGCKGKDCFCFITFTDRKEGLCAFEIGGAATKMIPKVVNELAGVLKKVFPVLVIMLFFCYSALPEETIEYNAQYLAKRIDALTLEVKGLREELKGHTESSKTQDANISTQDTKMQALEKTVDYLQDNIKYLYIILITSIGGNAISGGALWRQNKNRKLEPPAETP